MSRIRRTSLLRRCLCRPQLTGGGTRCYFEVPLHVDQAADAREEMAVGELGFWPVGDAFCIFFGPTPVSRAGEPRAYSPVNPFGMVVGDATVLRAAHEGDSVRVSRLEPS